MKTSTCDSITYDACGDELDDGDDVRHFTTPESALGYVRDLDCWWVGSDGAVACELRDDAHAAHAREIAATVRTDPERTQFTWPEIDLAEFEPRSAAAMPGQCVVGGAK